MSNFNVDSGNILNEGFEHDLGYQEGYKDRKTVEQKRIKKRLLKARQEGAVELLKEILSEWNNGNGTDAIEIFDMLKSKLKEVEANEK